MFYKDSVEVVENSSHINKKPYLIQYKFDSFHFPSQQNLSLVLTEHLFFTVIMNQL